MHNNTRHPPHSGQEMLIFKKIRAHLSYTMLLLEHFPGRLRFTLKDKILHQTLEITEMAIQANQIKPLNEADAQQRLRFQNTLLARLAIVDSLMQVATEQRALSLEQLDRWAAMTVEIRQMTLGWIKSDATRAARDKNGGSNGGANGSAHNSP